jgi:hypothetical protein
LSARGVHILGVALGEGFGEGVGKTLADVRSSVAHTEGFVDLGDVRQPCLQTNKPRWSAPEKSLGVAQPQRRVVALHERLVGGDGPRESSRLRAMTREQIDVLLQ